MHSKNQKRHTSPVSSRSPLVPMKPRALSGAPAAVPSLGDTLSFRVPKDFPHSRFSKAPLAVYPPKGARNKACISLPVVSLEKMPCLSRADASSPVRLASSSSSSRSPSTLKSTQRSGERLSNGRPSGGPPAPCSSGSTLPSSVRWPSPARSPLDRRPSSAPSPSHSPLDRRPLPSPTPRTGAPALPPSASGASFSPLERKQQNGAKATSRSNRCLSRRVFDPNKHCGVQDPETKRPCTRSLTCKTHSLTHRRSVPGRRTPFDLLLAEHKGRVKKEREEEKKEGVKEKDRDGGQWRKEGWGHSLTSPETTSPSKPHCPNGRLLSTLKLRLANAHIPRVPGSSSTSAPPQASPGPAPASHPELSSQGWLQTAGDATQLSSDEGDVEGLEDTDRPTCNFSTRHPQPLGCCVFSSRLIGRGHYVFDRRWDRMRLALQNMVEKHLNAQMWRKLPLATEGFLSSRTSAFRPQMSSSPSLDPPRLSFPSFCDPFYHAAPNTPSAAGLPGVPDSSLPAAPLSLQGKPHNGTPTPSSRPSREREEYMVGVRKVKNATSSSLSSPSSFPSGDIFKRNGGGSSPAFRGSAGWTTSPGWTKGIWGSAPGSGEEDRPSREERFQSHSTQNSLDLGSNISSASHLNPSPHPCPLGNGGGGAEGRKRRSPSSYGGKAAKLSRPGSLESLFRKRNGTGGDPVLRTGVPKTG